MKDGKPEYLHEAIEQHAANCKAVEAKLRARHSLLRDEVLSLDVTEDGATLTRMPLLAALGDRRKPLYAVFTLPGLLRSERDRDVALAVLREVKGALASIQQSELAAVMNVGALVVHGAREFTVTAVDRTTDSVSGDGGKTWIPASECKLLGGWRDE